ncbi:hypothetical protein QL285_016890 [Trifolium repens]|nr:hypothetical protein QL285_016890 [Trifolium repens]
MSPLLRVFSPLSLLSSGSSSPTLGLSWCWSSQKVFWPFLVVELIFLADFCDLSVVDGCFGAASVSIFSAMVGSGVMMGWSWLEELKWWLEMLRWWPFCLVGVV